MAITIDSYIDVQYSGVTVERIGLSAGMDTISNSDILDYVFCGSYNKIIHGVIPRKTDVSMTQYRQEIPFNFEMDDPRVQINIGGYDLNPNGMYMGVIWLYTDIFANHPENNGNLSHFKIVMEWDAPNYFATCPEPNGRRDNITSWSASDASKCFATTGTYTALTYVFQNNNINVPDIYPYMVFKTTEGGDDLLFISCLRQNANTFRVRPYTRGTQIRFIGTTTLKSFRNNEQTYSPVGAKMLTYEKTLPYKWNMGSSPGQASTNPNAYGTTEMQNLFFYTEGGSNAASTIGCMDWTWYLDTKNESLLFWASGGLKFKAGTKTYKPIIQGGIVTGFSDDMSKPSDLDNWSGSTKHGIPITPPSPKGDVFDDHEMGAGTGISGMATLWLLTKSQLDDLHGAFNNAPVGFDPMNSLISVMGLGVSPIYLMDDIQYITPINIRKSDGTSWSTGVEGHIVDAQKSAFQFTGITVNRMYNNFLDFSPYAIHEIFIPMCGWLTLPDIAVDRSITVTYLPDIESLKCRAVVSVVDNSGNRCVIGEKDGIMGADVPFTNTGHSLYVGEAIVNGMNVAGEVITGAIGAGFTKTNAKGGTYRPYEGFTVGMGGTLPGAIGNAIVSGQTNRTHYMTGNGTRIGFSDGENIQIKSTYHNIDKPTNYDHTVGKVCNKSGQLSEFSGFTICDNPHINISALEEEKSEIKALLEQGVIL